MQASAVGNAQKDDHTLVVADLISAYEKGVEELRFAVAGMTVEQLRTSCRRQMEFARSGSPHRRLRAVLR